MQRQLIVSPNAVPALHEFSSISDALSSLSFDDNKPVTIFLRKGIYREKLIIHQPFVTLEGEDRNSTMITWGDYARMFMENGKKRGTFRTPTVMVDANDFTAKNLTFENSAGLGRRVGPALALYVNGDRIRFEHCNFLGSQDTLCTAPLPPAPYEIEGFTSSKKAVSEPSGRHFYYDCFIRGDVDYIFGSAVAYFEQCELFSQQAGYITAASTPQGQKYGYVFSHCRLTGNCPDASVYLGRPWRKYAKTVFLNCELDAHIHPAGWHDWNNPNTHSSLFYAEYQNIGIGADTANRVSFSKQLNDFEAKQFQKELVLCGADGWNPIPI